MFLYEVHRDNCTLWVYQHSVYHPENLPILEIYALLINLNERVKCIVNESRLCLCNHCGVSESIIFCQIVYQLTAESEVRRAEELVGLYKSRFEGGTDGR